MESTLEGIAIAMAISISILYGGSSLSGKTLPCDGREQGSIPGHHPSNLSKCRIVVLCLTSNQRTRVRFPVLALKK